MGEKRGAGALVAAMFLCALLFPLLACSKPCKRCAASGKVLQTVPCPECVGTGSVRRPCPSCAGRDRTKGDRRCPYCQGKGRVKCTYQETFPFVPYGVCSVPADGLSKYAPRELVTCVNGRLQGRDAAVDEAFGRTKKSRLCPQCLGTAEHACTFCEGSGKLSGEVVCADCAGSGEVLQTCPRCKGAMRLTQVESCPECGGKGKRGPFD